jgi:hypothetical protein
VAAQTARNEPPRLAESAQPNGDTAAMGLVKMTTALTINSPTMACQWAVAFRRAFPLVHFHHLELHELGSG